MKSGELDYFFCLFDFPHNYQFFHKSSVHNFFLEFKSILSLRQQHDVFYGQSDFYFICRLNPLTFDVDPCPDEIERCEWMSINDLLIMKDSTPFVKMICRLFLIGEETGFHNVDMQGQEIESWVTKNKMMWIYHRPMIGQS